MGEWNGGMLIFADVASDLFTMGVPMGEKVLRTVAVYGGLVALLRIAGKRDLAQLNSLDLVVLLLLSNVVQNAVIGADNSLWGGLVGAVVLIAVNALLSRAGRSSPALATALEGTPTTIVEDGRLLEPALRRLGLRSSDVITAIRRQDASSLDEVKQAVLEPGGAIVVDLKDDAVNATRADVARLEAKLDALLAREG